MPPHSAFAQQPLVLPTPARPASQRALQRPAALWLLCLAFTLLWDLHGIDLPVMRWLGNSQGFALQHNWWLEKVLHNSAQKLSTVLYLVLWLMVWWPRGTLKSWSRRERLGVVLCITLALLATSGMKQLSQTSCPANLAEFGGTAQYVSHWAWGVLDGGSGHCFPGGHASSALGFVALAFPFLARPDVRNQRRGHAVLAAVLATGVLLGLAQTLRGAHYPSHTLWTLLLCTAVSAAAWRLWLLLPAQPQMQR
jgi:membrane-associated PAP2 superfamily phosphatase